MAGLLDLPTEIILAILVGSSIDDIMSFAYVSSHCHGCHPFRTD